MDDLLWLLGAAALIGWAYSRGAGSTVETAGETLMAAISGWQNVNDGPVWVPVINESEAAHGIPTNLLARQAYQESHFREAIITGVQASPAGALGILQLMPEYFATVRVAVPFSAADTTAQITEAAGEMARLFAVFNDWGLALAAYNDGQGNVNQYLAGSRPLPLETQNYVAQILTDVPQPSVLNA